MESSRSPKMSGHSWKPFSCFCATFLITFTLINSGVTAPSDSAEGLTLKYEPGKTYTYDYETNSVIKLLGTSDEQSQVQLKGQVLLTPSTRNDFVLTLGDFVLDVTSPNEKLASPVAALKGSSSRFTTEGGVIQNFYVKGDESAWVANFHRAIVSAFNNYALKDSQQAFYLENDVSGSNCPTEYKIKPDGSFHKKRDLNKCLNRDGGYTEQYGVPYAPINSDEPTSDTSIRSSQECVQKYANGVLNSGECTEVHRVTLLSTAKDNGGNAHVTSKLQLKNVGGGGAPASVPSKLSSILFDHAGTDLKTPSDAADIIEGLVGKLCLSIGNAGRLSSDTAAVFLTLKSKIRFASKQVLETVYNKLKGGKICEDQVDTLVKLYTDAVLMAGSSESIAFGAQLVSEGAVSKNSEKRFRVYTAFANRPGEAALKSVLNLLDSIKDTGRAGGPLDSRYLLTASGIAYQFCLNSKSDCGSNKAYAALVKKISELTVSKCQRSGQADSARDAVLGLQALGNLNRLMPEAVNAIKTCLGENSDRIKIHALQAIRRDPCQQEIRTEARKILSNSANPAHVRISAYLALSQCYNSEDSAAIRSFIKTEESIQVLSFLKSHRENAWSRNSNERTIDKNIFEEVNFDKLQNDIRKFSSSLAFNDDLDDHSTNVIYSDDSFLPKIIYSNSSAKLFGQDFGLVEFGAHLGGLEQDAMEQAFGENPAAFWEKPHRRPRRQSSSDAPTLSQNEIDAFHSKVKIPERKTVPSDIYFRLFGTTVYANSFTIDDLSTKTSRKAYMADLFDRAMKGEEISFNEAYPLYGDELIVPTVSGLSLWIQNEGAAIVSLKYSHTASEDFVNFSPKLKPGISVANNMKLTVAGDIIEAGLRAETTAAASTDISLTTTLSATDEQYGLEVKINMPPSDVKLIDFSNELFWTLQTRHSDYDQKQKMATKIPSAVDTGVQCTKYLPKVTGVKGCFQAQLPPPAGRKVPNFPLSGPAKVRVTLSPPAGARELVLRFKVSKPDNEGLFKPFVAEIDAPGSSENIKAVFKASYVTENGYKKFSVDLDSPKLKAGFSTLRAVDVPGVKDFTVKFYHDDKQYQINFKRQGSNDTASGVESKSLGLSYKLPGQNEIQVFTLDLSSVLPGSNRIYRSLALTINDVSIGSPDVKPFIAYSSTLDGAMGGLLSVKSQLAYRGKQLLAVKGSAKKLTDSTMQIDLDNIINFPSGVDEDLNIKGELSGLGASTKTGFKGTIKSVSRPVLNGDVEAAVSYPEPKLFQYVLNVKSPKIDIKVTETIDRRDGKLKLSYDGKVICQEMKLNKERTHQIEFGPDKVLVNLRYASDGKPVTDVKFKFDRASNNYDAEILVFLSGNKNLFKSKNSNAGDRLVFEHSAEVEGKFTGSVKTEIFDSKDSEGTWKNRETTLKSDAFPDDYVLKIKYNLQSGAVVKVNRGGKEIGAFSVSNKAGADGTHNFMLDISAENVIVASVAVKGNRKQEKLEIVGSVTAPPQTGPQRVAKFVIDGKGADPPGQKNFDISFDLKMDAGKDPKSTFAITNSNRWRKSAGGFSLESDNAVVVKGNSRTANFKVNGVEEGETQKLSVTFDHVNPDGKADHLEISGKHEFPHGKVMVTITFEGFGEGGTFEIGFKNFNGLENTGVFLTKYNCHQRGRVFDVAFYSKKTEAGTRLFEVAVGGFEAIVDSGIQQDLTVETGKGKHRVNLEGKIGAKAIYLNINLEKTKGTTLKKYVLDLEVDRDYQKQNGPALSTKTTFAYRFNTAFDFEIQATGQYDLKRDGKFSHSFSRSVKASPGSVNVDFSSTIQYGANAPEKSELKVNLENSDKKLVVIVDAENKLLGLISGNENIQPRIDFDFETTKNINDLQLVLAIKLPTEKFQTGSLNIKRTAGADGVSRISKVSGKLNQEQIEIETTLYLTEAKKTADVSLKLNNETPKKLSLKYDTAGGHAAEATYTWGDNGQQLTSKGSMTKDANDGFTAKFEFDVPAMNQQWNLEVSRQLAAAKKSISFAATSQRSKQHIKFNIEQEQTQKSAYGGSLNIDLAAPNDKYDFDGTLKVVVDKSQASKTLSFKLDYIVGEDKRSRSVSIDSAISPEEKQVEGKLSLTPENTFQLKSNLKTQELENKFEFSLQNPSLGLDASASAGLTLSADKKTRLTSVKYSLAHPSLKGKKELGISLYKKPGTGNDLELTKSEISAAPSKVTTRGFELTLPERTYAAHIVYADWNAVDARAGELNLWFDKKAAPNQKLAIGYACSKPSVEEGQGGDLAFIIRHHKLQKDLRVKNKYRFTGSSSKVFEAQTDLDIFKRPEDKLSFKIDLTHDVNTDTYTSEHGIYSDGQGIFLQTKCEGISINFPEFASTCTITRKLPNINPIIYKVQIKTSDTEELIQVYNGQERIFHYKATLEAGDGSSLSVLTQLQLPGMTDIRNINARLAKNPFRLTLSTNPSSSKDVTGLWIGATSQQGGGFGLSRTDEAGEKKDLVSFSANVKSKKLVVDFNWSKDNIASYLAYVVRRGKEVEKSAVKTCNQINKQEWEARQAFRKSLKSASQDFEPILQWYEVQLTRIATKYGANPVKFPRGSFLRDEAAPQESRFVARLNAGNKCLQENADSINAFLDSISKRPTLPTPEAVKERSKKVREFAEEAANNIRKVLEDTKALKEKFPFLKKPARKVREKVVARLQSIVDETSDDLNELYPYPEVSHFLEHFRNYFEIALLEPEKVSQDNKTEMLGDLEKAVEKILSRTYSINFGEGRIRAKIPLFHKFGSFPNRYGGQHFGRAQSECIKEVYDDPSSILPPVNATAFIIGASTYVTFDGTEGTIDKLCPLLLASDFVNKNLSVAIDLTGSRDAYGLGSTLFVTDHKISVGIHRGYGQVVINGRITTAGTVPFRTGAFIVYKDGGFTIVEGDMGITVGCSDVGICAVQVSGFYHGKLQGVFGKYNNNPYDDLTLPTGQVSSNEAAFQGSWKLNSKCSGRASSAPELLPSLYEILKRKDLDIDNFFSRSSSAPYKSFYSPDFSYSSGTVVAPLTFLSIVISSILAFILARLN